MQRHRKRLGLRPIPADIPLLCAIVAALWFPRPSDGVPDRSGTPTSSIRRPHAGAAFVEASFTDCASRFATQEETLFLRSFPDSSKHLSVDATLDGRVRASLAAWPEPELPVLPAAVLPSRPLPPRPVPELPNPEEDPGPTAPTARPQWSLDGGSSSAEWDEAALRAAAEAVGVDGECHAWVFFDDDGVPRHAVLSGLDNAVPAQARNALARAFLLARRPPGTPGAVLHASIQWSGLTPEPAPVMQTPPIDPDTP